MPRYYEILGVSPFATEGEIKQAWLFSVKAFHPDKFSRSSPSQQRTAQERTKRINEAYAVLSDPVNRANYDRERRAKANAARSSGAAAASPRTEPHAGSEPRPDPSPPPVEKEQPSTPPASAPARSGGLLPVYAVAAFLVIAGVALFKSLPFLPRQPINSGVRSSGAFESRAYNARPVPRISQLQSDTKGSASSFPVASTVSALPSAETKVPVVDAADWIQRIKAQMAIVCRASKRGDYAVILDHSNPNAIALMGGRQQALAVIKTSMDELKSKGLTITSADFGEPSQPMRSNGKLFSVVPTSTVMTLRKPHARITQKSFMLAMSLDEGVSWSLTDGTVVMPDALSVLVPDLPPDLRLPKIQSPEIQRLK